MTASIASGLLAHQGGWDEVLLIVGPLVAIVGIVILAKARIDESVARADERADTDGAIPEPH